MEKIITTSIKYAVINIRDARDLADDYNFSNICARNKYHPLYIKDYVADPSTHTVTPTIIPLKLATIDNDDKRPIYKLKKLKEVPSICNEIDQRLKNVNLIYGSIVVFEVSGLLSSLDIVNKLQHYLDVNNIKEPIYISNSEYVIDIVYIGN